MHLKFCNVKHLNCFISYKRVVIFVTLFCYFMIVKNKFCRKSGCNNFATKDGYCNEHQFMVVKRKEHTPHVKEYDWKWRQVRNKYIADHPLCEECEKKGITKPAREVHHIKPLEYGGDKFNYDNLKSLCPKCHRQAHIDLLAYEFVETQIKKIEGE